MITVRFPDGTSIQYNNANYIDRHSDGYTRLFDCDDKEKRRLIAQVPTAMCVVEFSPPCRVYNALTSEGSIHTLMGAMRNFGAYSAEIGALIKLKKELAKLNARSRTWRD